MEHRLNWLPGCYRTMLAVCFLALIGVCSSFSPITTSPISTRGFHSNHFGSNAVVPRDYVARYSSTDDVIEPNDLKEDVDSDDLIKSAESAEEDDSVEEDDSALSEEREKLKRSLIALGASFDRGFGATPSSRTEADRIVDQLEKVNPTANAARGISGEAVNDAGPAPLEGIWRMVWTNAQDVLTLAASPLSTVGAIYQVIEPPVATNIIDLIPRAQALLPPGLAPPTLVRAEVTTRASPRANMPERVGLLFEAVKVRPMEVFGVSTKDKLPPLSFNLPKIPGADAETSPGFFDVAYLDDEMLVIRQNAPGGYFALIKVQNYDP